MSGSPLRPGLKRMAGSLPAVPEIYQRWITPGQPPPSGYALEKLEKVLPEWLRAAIQTRERYETKEPRRILVFGYLVWWLEYVTALALYLYGLGHSVQLATLPYRRWDQDMPAFDLRRQRAYLRSILGQIEPQIELKDFSLEYRDPLHPDLEMQVLEQSLIDTQYTLQTEEFDLDEGSKAWDLYHQRTRRNRLAMQNALETLAHSSFDAVIIPNGSILEFGAVYRAAIHQGTTVVTFEFGEQQERIWLAEDAEVMKQDTSALWAETGGKPLTERERKRIDQLYEARTGGRSWSVFQRQWQSAGGGDPEAAIADLNLQSEKPIALLCTNVVADSLALGRQVFTEGMADWLRMTVRFFAEHPEWQLVIRVHPGELLGAGHPSVEIVRGALPAQPEHVVVVPPEAKINTYDLIQKAHLGLTYSTTVGMEMAMYGIPVVVSGQTHYRGRGFTRDPLSKDEYLETIARLMEEPLGRKLGDHEVSSAWEYAYRFFFEYPFPFPWHLLQFWADIEERPMAFVLEELQQERLQVTNAALVGDGLRWERRFDSDPEA